MNEGAEPAPAPSQDELSREVLLASVGILVALTVVKHLGAAVPALASYAFTAAAGIQLYVPILLIGKRGITKETLGLRLDRWREDLRLMVVLSALTVVPFALGHHLWQTILFRRSFTLRFPEGLLSSALIQLFVVAFAEELFYRGYLQERMTRLWPARRQLFGVPFGRAIVLASTVFALAHFVGEYNPLRLGPFFPALLFGLLRQRTGSILSAMGYHAFCNLLADVLWACYR